MIDDLRRIWRMYWDMAVRQARIAAWTRTRSAWSRVTAQILSWGTQAYQAIGTTHTGLGASISAHAEIAVVEHMFLKAA